MTSATPLLRGIPFKDPAVCYKTGGGFFGTFPLFLFSFTSNSFFNRFIAWSREGILSAYLSDLGTA